MPTHPDLGKSLSWFPMHTIYGTRLAIGLMRSKNSSHYNVTQAAVTAIVCSPYRSSISIGIANVSNMEDHVYRVDLTFDTVGGVNGSWLRGNRLQCIILLGLTHIWETERNTRMLIFIQYTCTYTCAVYVCMLTYADKVATCTRLSQHCHHYVAVL